MEFQPYHTAKKAEWDQFIDHSKNGSFHLKRDFIEYHGDKFPDDSLMCYDKGRLIAVLPGAVINNNYHSHPGLTYGGLVVKKDIYLSKYLELFSNLVSHLKNRGLDFFTVKMIPTTYTMISNDDFLYCMFNAEAKVSSTHVLPHVKLSEKLPYQDRRKRAIKKANEINLKFTEETDYEDYWVLLGDLLNEYGTQPVHTLEEITYLHQCFPEHIRLFEVKNEDTLLAGVVIFETDRVARAQYIASTSEGKSLGALDYLFDILINKIFNEKEWFEFGTTTLDGGKKINLGLSDQKEGFGARSILQLAMELDLRKYDEHSFKMLIK